jgi:hypothetical protein
MHVAAPTDFGWQTCLEVVTRKAASIMPNCRTEAAPGGVHSGSSGTCSSRVGCPWANTSTIFSAQALRHKGPGIAAQLPEQHAKAVIAVMNNHPREANRGDVTARRHQDDIDTFVHSGGVFAQDKHAVTAEIIDSTRDRLVVPLLYFDRQPHSVAGALSVIHHGFS